MTLFLYIFKTKSCKKNT